MFDRPIFNGLAPELNSDTTEGKYYSCTSYSYYRKYVRCVMAASNTVWEKWGDWFGTEGYLLSPEVVAFGLHLKPAGTKVWWPTPPEPHVQTLYPPGLDMSPKPGIVVLGIPFGTDIFIRDTIIAKANEVGEALRELESLEDAHSAFSLARTCFSTCRMNYLLRTTHPSLTTAEAQLFDEHLYRFTTYLAGGMLDRQVFRELQLPVAIQDTNHPHAGTGLTSAVSIAPAAFLASLTAARTGTLPFVTASQFDDDEQDALRRSLAQIPPHARTAHDHLVSRTNQSACPSAQEVCNDPAKYNQTTLTRIIHIHVAQSLNNSDVRTMRFRQSLLLPGAKDWLKCMPTPGLLTHIHHKAFQRWFMYYARNQQAYGPACSRRQCKAKPDPFGDHFLICKTADPNGNHVIVRRHDQIVRLLAHVLRQARRAPLVEPRLPAAMRQHSRPDIKALGTTGGEDLIDVAIIHPSLRRISEKTQ